jgi:hypothetical protein
MKSELKTRSLKDLSAAYVAKELRVNPEYQRGLQWGMAQKQGLIDSLLRGYQIPIFLAFKQEVAAARLHHRESRQSLPHHERFGQLLSGSGSDTAEVIRLRHAFMLSELYPKIRVVPRDPTRCFDLLEREVIWNRDRGQCQNPGCSRSDRRVAFRDARIHHIVEHSVGGSTTLRNGVLICPECHANRASMQDLTQRFQEYIARVYDRSHPSVDELSPEEREADGPNDWNGGGTEGIKIVIDWGALDIDRPEQTIRKGNDADTIVELLRLLLDEFKKPMAEQLTEIPIVRFPLSPNPKQDFLNRAKNKPYSYTPIPGTDPTLYFCPQSGRSQKVERLRALFARLTLPDGSEFPENCITVTIEGSA